MRYTLPTDKARFPRPPRGELSIKKIKGNTLGLKPSQVKRLERLYQRRCPPDKIIYPELARELTELSREIKRQVGILVDRGGKLRDVLVGDARQIELSDVGRYRAGQRRLRGLRYLHTHLQDEPLSHDDLTDLALLRFDLVAAIAANESGLPGTVYWAHLDPDPKAEEPWRLESEGSVHRLELDFNAFIKGLENEFQNRTGQAQRVGRGRRALLVGVTTGRMETLRESMDELRELTVSADIEVVDHVLQRRHRLDKRFVVGSGKMKELYIDCMRKDIDLMIFDGELSSSQVRAISEFGELEVWDRTQLILDIFGRRARSRGGKLQVELAMLKYSLPRLVLKDDFLSRLTGGIGARGPGETKFEVLRRRVRDRIARLERELKDLSKRRRVRRSARNRSGLPILSLVGYTNAGKSTLLNQLTGSDILAEDRLFATLDPTSRKLYLPSGNHAILTDTVGFIRELPDELAKAFHATLEELHEADLLLHVVDLANPRYQEQVLAVDNLLADLALDNIPILLLLNKSDRVEPEILEEAGNQFPGAPLISAKSGAGVREMLALAEEMLGSGG